MFADVCEDMAWKEDNNKYLKKRRVDGKTVQMLVDTGSDRTIISGNIVERAKMWHEDLYSYTTA